MNQWEFVDDRLLVKTPSLCSSSLSGGHNHQSMSPSISLHLHTDLETKKTSDHQLQYSQYCSSWETSYNVVTVTV